MIATRPHRLRCGNSAHAKRPICTLLTARWLILSGVTAVTFVSASHSSAQTPSGAVWEWGARVIVPGFDFRDLAAVSAGQSHCLGLKTDGSVVAWGLNDSLQCAVPEPNSGFIAVAAGGDHSLALKEDGSVVAWGDNRFGQCDPPAGEHFVAVSAGGYHSLGLKADGHVLAWGSNWAGQCTVPDSVFTSVVAGFSHCIGLTPDSTLVAWGDPRDGRLLIPDPNRGFVAVSTSSGAGHNLALKPGGTIVAWGYDYYHQCQNIPEPNVGFVSVSAGTDHSMALTADGAVAVWGAYVPGVLDAPTPNVGFSAMAGGGNYCLALRPDGALVAWGINWSGACNIPPVNGRFVAVAGGVGHRIGLRSDGTIAAWGALADNQGDVPPDDDFVGIAAGGYHNLGLKSSGAVAAWGRNTSNQVSPLPPYSDFVKVAAGAEHSLALRAGGSIVVWGDNRHGQSGIPNPNADFVGIAASGYNNLGLKADGSIVAWGSDAQQVPGGLNTGFVALAAGSQHGLGLRDDSSVVAWGSNLYGQCDVPAPNADFVAVAAYGEHSLGLKSNGTVVAWGRNTSHQTAVPPALAGATAIGACGSGGLAVTTLEPPANLAATYAAGRRIALSWHDATVDEDGFELYRLVSGSQPLRVEIPIPNTTAYTDTDLQPGTEYTYRLAAYDRWRVSPFDSASATTNAAPIVTHSAPAGVAGQGVVVSAHIVHARPVASVSVDYRLGGGSATPWTVPMHATGDDQWEVGIPPGGFGATGLQYCLRIFDGIDTWRYPAAPAFCSLNVMLSEYHLYSLVGGDRQEDYSMLAVPCVAADPDPVAVFNEFGPYSRRNWRLFRWNPAASSTLEYSGAESLVPGVGFWLISRSSAQISTDGLSTSLASPYEIPVQHGWNQIGNPFSFALPFSSVVWPMSDGAIHEYIGSPDTLYRQHLLDQPGQLAPGLGYWFYYAGAAASDTVCVYPFPDMLPSAVRLASRPRNAAEAASSWTCGIRLCTEVGGDAGFRLGLRPGASDGLDVGDYYAPPPPPGQRVSLALLSEGGEALLTDYRGVDAEGASWTLSVQARDLYVDFALEFSMAAPPPAGWEVRAVDMTDLREYDLTNGGTICGRLGASAVERRWQISAGSAAYLSDARDGIVEDLLADITSLALVSATPNPLRAGGELRLSIAAPTDGNVALTVYDLRGRRIAGIQNGPVARGVRHFAWPSRDDQGRSVAAGIYILRLRAPGVDVSRKVTVVR